MSDPAPSVPIGGGAIAEAIEQGIRARISFLRNASFTGVSEAVRAERDRLLLTSAAGLLLATSKSGPRSLNIGVAEFTDTNLSFLVIGASLVLSYFLLSFGVAGYIDVRRRRAALAAEVMPFTDQTEPLLKSWRALVEQATSANQKADEVRDSLLQKSEDVSEELSRLRLAAHLDPSGVQDALLAVEQRLNAYRQEFQTHPDLTHARELIGLAEDVGEIASDVHGEALRARRLQLAENALIYIAPAALGLASLATLLAGFARVF